MEATPYTGTLVAGLAFVLAFVFGAVAQRTNFCTLGAVSDWINIGDLGRMRMWLLAIAVATVAANAMHVAGVVDLRKSIYVTPNFTWLSYVIGGALFGVGMTLGSGCGSKTLIRIGTGNLKSVVVFVFLGIAAMMTLRGLFGLWRVEWLQPVAVNFERWSIASQDLPTVLAGGGVPARALVLGCALAVSVALAAFVFASREFRANREGVVGGVVVGLVVALGWYVTSNLGYRENPDTLEMTFYATNSRAAESFSFVAPVAYTLELLMAWTDKSLRVTFGIAAVAGVILGSLAMSLATRTFRWESFTSAADMRNHMWGGVLMGFGGVTALGCTIGQGISGVSTLALGSFLTLASIIAGSALTMKIQFWRMMREP
ncbi:MAG: YeeE/YedE family protein [Proteobacteria bacterium]|nr:YeeE/YedE family protein [Burkholderiales bacterium]